MAGAAKAAPKGGFRLAAFWTPSYISRERRGAAT
jgi:hypothetical protein